MDVDLQRKFNNACANGDLQTVKALINDPDVNPSINDNFPIRYATLCGHKEVVEFLMQDPRVDPSDGDNCAICLAAFYGHKQVVELLLIDKRVMDNIEYALKWCKEYGNYELLKGCVDEHKRELKRQEKERRIQEAIEEMSADCELYF